MTEHPAVRWMIFAALALFVEFARSMTMSLGLPSAPAVAAVGA